jgi:hypothetical protein
MAEQRNHDEATGISNRETAAEEAREREQYPPVETPTEAAPDAEGAAGQEAVVDLQTSHKAGSRSDAQKQQETRHPDGPAPPSNKVAGAFGKEP